MPEHSSAAGQRGLSAMGVSRNTRPFVRRKDGTWYSDGVTGMDAAMIEGRIFAHICGLSPIGEAIGRIELVYRDGEFSVQSIAEEPILCPTGCGFDALHVCDPALICINSRYHLYYSGLGYGQDSIGLAFSEDGRTFTRIPEPLFAGRAPCAVLRDGKLYLYYVMDNLLGGYDIHLAVSEDGYSFRPLPDAVLTASGTGWDAKSVSTPRIMEGPDGTLYCFYCADAEEKDIPRSIGVAAGRDGIHWTKAASPLLTVGAAGSFDDSALWLPSPLLLDGRVFLWYEGGHLDGTGAMISSIGLAELPFSELKGLFY